MKINKITKRLSLILVFTLLLSLFVPFIHAEEAKDAKVTKESVKETIDKVFEFFKKNGASVDSANNGPNSSDWKGGTYYLGVIDAYKATGDEKYLTYTYDHIKSKNFISNSHKNGEMTNYLDAIQKIHVIHELDRLGENVNLTHSSNILKYCMRFSNLDYTWIDEIYMGAQSFIYETHKTGDTSYFFADYYSYSYYRNILFNFEDGLWYRDNRYIHDLENPMAFAEDGEKIYWSRGNTWVYVSLARRIEMMQEFGMTEGIYEEAYNTYVYDLILMSYALKDVQRDDGFWDANLSESTAGKGKETTGTSGFLYGLATGIRLGILDRDTFLPSVEACYNGLITHAVKDTGLLGYCQPVGEGPTGYVEKSAQRKTNNFGVGLFLMGASAYMQIIEK